MANKINDQRLFEYIHLLGPVNNYKGNLTILDHTGPMAEGGNSYRGFIKGGIQFDIAKEKTDNGWEYFCDIIWAGPFEASESTDIIATLLWLKHQFPKEVFA